MTSLTNTSITDEFAVRRTRSSRRSPFQPHPLPYLTKEIPYARPA